MFFAVGTLLIALPTGLKIFNWTATMWGGSIRLTTAMMFAVAFLLEFVIGGLTGVMFAAVPIDWQLTDTYFVVGHFHYVLIGGTVFGLFSATYYWFPKMTGRMLSERLGKWQLWLWVFGLNATFLSQHVLGVMGMPRRVYTYADNPGWMALNAIAGAGAVAMAGGTIVLMINIWVSLRRGEEAGDNPWEGFTLEWATSSPPPPENFAVIPVVDSRRPVWDLDHPDLADAGREQTPADSGWRPDKSVTSVWAFVASETVFFLLLLVAYVVFNTGIAGEITSATVLDVTRTAFFSVALLGSSFTLWKAETLLKAGKLSQFRGWLALTIALGAVFIGGQAIEYYGLISSDVTIDDNLFTATFFTVTGFHGLHVIVGLVALSIAFVLAAKQDRNVLHGSALKAIGIYWHFVDVVWIAVFCIIYLRFMQ